MLDRTKNFFGILLVAGFLVFASPSVFASAAGYDMSGEFNQKINQNFLDRDYAIELKNAKTTLDYVQLESKYIKLWDAELNQSYQKLLLQLGDSQRSILMDSQEGWVRWHMKETEFANALLARQTGTIWPVVTAKAYKARLRDRTIELLEYSYLISHQVNFVYRGVSDSTVE